MTVDEDGTVPSPQAVSAGDQEASRNAQRVALRRMTKARLIRMCADGVTTPSGGRRVIEGGMYRLDQWSKADIIASIMSAKFPPPAATPPSPGDSAPGS